MGKSIMNDKQKTMKRASVNFGLISETPAEAATKNGTGFRKSILVIGEEHQNKIKTSIPPKS